MNEKVKKLQKGFILFTIGQFLVLIGSFSYLGTLKVIPQWVENLSLFSLVGVILFIFALSKIYFFNKHFLHSYITSFIVLVIAVLQTVAADSKTEAFVAWSRGLLVSSDILLCITYVYFFMGVYLFFVEEKILSGVRNAKITYTFIITAFILKNIFSFVKSFNEIKVQPIAYMVFNYGTILIQLVFDVVLLVSLITIMVYVQKHYQKGEKLPDGKEEE